MNPDELAQCFASFFDYKLTSLVAKSNPQHRPNIDAELFNHKWIPFGIEAQGYKMIFFVVDTMFDP